MKTKYPIAFVVLVALLIIAGLLQPINFVKPTSVVADAGVCKWSTTDMPGSVDIGQVIIDPADNSFIPSEVEKLVALSDGESLLAVVNRTPIGAAPLDDPLVLYVGSYKGISWSSAAYKHLADAMSDAGDNIANV